MLIKILLLVVGYIFFVVLMMALAKSAKRGDQILGIENYYKEVGD